MESSAHTIATEALQELLEVSPQVTAAIVTDRAGTPVAASLGSRAATDADARLGKLLARILDQAERARVELDREPVTQLEVASGDGNIFVVRDAQHVVAAMTGNEPTVGLVFYDLKTALRTLREATPGNNGQSSNGRGGTNRKTKGVQA